jgi:ubiquinone/menaquinone biosynthesis C-methylase UbiE
MSFDRLAPHYRAMERMLAGPRLQRCRLAWLEKIQQPANILVLGEGHGRFLPELVRRFPDCPITCLDASSAMLMVAQGNLQRLIPQPANIQWVHSDVMKWTAPPSAYDLVVTHFFLDCFTATELDALVTKISASLKPRAEWLLADFHLPVDGVRRMRAKVILWLMYRFFRVATRLSATELVSPAPWLSAQGFMLKQQKTFEWGLLHSQLWERS